MSAYLKTRTFCQIFFIRNWIFICKKKEKRIYEVIIKNPTTK
jgi:uncharacterized pyridoxamine 5'-phosphate oxidase family protein